MSEITINQRLEIFLDSKNISRSDLSRRWHVSKQAVTNWLNNYSHIPIKHVAALSAEFTELNVRWLLNGTGEMESEVVKVDNMDSALARKDGMIELLLQQLEAKDKKIHELMMEQGKLEYLKAMEASGSNTKSDL